MHTYKKVLLALSALQAINGADVPRFPVKKNYGSSNTVAKRSSTGELLFEIAHEQTYYSVEVILGSNKQNVTAVLDTGSSDLWILGTNSSGVDACDAYLDAAGYKSGGQSSNDSQEIQFVDNVCDLFGTFSSSKSDTFKVQKADNPFYILYSDLSFAEGYWGSDSLTVNGVEVDSLLFAVAEISNSSSVLGIGFMQNEASNFNFTLYSNSSTGNVPAAYVTESGNAFTYKNLPYVMKDQGLIERVSYSLFLNGIHADSGDLLFGAIDTSKYVGDLNTVPLVNVSPQYYNNPVQFDITLQGVGFVSESGQATTLNTQYFPALANSATIITQAYSEIAAAMASAVGATYSPDLGFFLMNCPSYSQMEKSAFVFQFGGVNYFVPYESFVLPTSNLNTCVLAVIPTLDQHVILGANILSSLYVVYDLENYELSLARANYAGAETNESSDIVSIPNASSTLSIATKAPGYSNTWSAAISTFSTGGDMFDGSTSVANPWATSAAYLNQTAVTSSGATSTSSNSDNSTTTLTSHQTGGDSTDGNGSSTHDSGASTSDGGSHTGTSTSSHKSKNGASVFSGSLIALLAALFV